MKQVWVLIAGVAIAMAALPLRAAPQDDKKVHAEGCVEAGVETGCLVVKDIKSGKVYNILVKDPKPKVGSGIEFTGAVHQGVTMCMQGTPVEVDHWEQKDTLKCGEGEAK